MLGHVLRHRVNASVSYKPGNFYANTLIHSSKRQSLWAGLTLKSPERACTNSFGSQAKDIPKDTEDISSKISHISKAKKAKTVKNGEKKHRKQQKKAAQDKDLTLPENGKVISKKRTVKKRSDKSTSGIAENQNHKSQDEDRPPTLSFPFEGSSYTETDDEFGIHHRDLCGLHCSGDRSVVHRMDDCTSEGRFYHISSASASVVFPSVTTILSNTLTKSQYYMLRNWKKSMVKEHGEDGFESIQQLTKDTGTHFHKKLEQKLVKLMLPDAISIKPQLSVSEKIKIPSLKTSAVDTDVMTTAPFNKSSGSLADKLKLNNNECVETDSGYMKSVRHVLEQITSVLALESVVTHHELGYTGTLDCVAKYRGEVCLVDWKSSARPKPTLKDCYDFPLQAVAYAGAINYDDHYHFKVFNALIVVAYADGEPAHAHFLSHEQCQHYWSNWLHRLQEYQTQFASDHSNVY